LTTPPAPAGPSAPSAPGSASLPSAGKAALSAAPIKVAAPGSSLQPAPLAQPRTDRYNVEYHTCVVEDTWEKLAATYYSDERAAAALKEYNRYHPHASDLMRTEGRLAPGEKVAIPPLRILKERHGL
jgi:hypothetical protein